MLAKEGFFFCSPDLLLGVDVNLHSCVLGINAIRESAGVTQARFLVVFLPSMPYIIQLLIVVREQTTPRKLMLSIC